MNLCTLPRGATGCAGGIQTIASAPDSIGTSTAAGLRVLVSKSNLVTLVWMHSTVASENGPEGDEIAIATSQAAASCRAEKDVSAGPSFGYLLDAALAPGGKIWAVTQPLGRRRHSLQVTRGLGSAPQTVKPPFLAGPRRPRVQRHQRGARHRQGRRDHPAGLLRQAVGRRLDRRSRPSPRRGTSPGSGMAATTRGVRLIAAENNAGYHPVVSSLTSAGLSTPALTGDTQQLLPGRP